MIPYDAIAASPVNSTILDSDISQYGLRVLGFKGNLIYYDLLNVKDCVEQKFKVLSNYFRVSRLD